MKKKVKTSFSYTNRLEETVMTKQGYVTVVELVNNKRDRLIKGFFKWPISF